MRRAWYTRIWNSLGSLYTGTDDEGEEHTIREQCEAWDRGDVPMGYGRVPRTPVQLNDAEAGGQWGEA